MLSSILLLNTDGATHTLTITTDDEISTAIPCEHVDCASFTVSCTQERITVWFDDEGVCNQEANVLGTIIIKELCGPDAQDYFTHQQVLYGPLVITATSPDLPLAADTINAITNKLTTYLTAFL